MLKSKPKVVLPQEEVPSKPDPLTQELIDESKRSKSEQEDFENEVKARKKYSWRVYSLVVLWLFYVAIVVLLQGFKGINLLILHATFNLSNEVLIALITSATATVIGLFTIIIRYFFSRPQPKTKPKTKQKK